MHGRMGDGFATAVIARIDSEGGLMLASAGHMPPFLNRDEVDLPGSLPLGLMPGSSYEETVFELRPGDQLTFYTDGLLEARSHSGELYGFERVRTLFASRPTAAEATQAAIQFGQDDDITVLTLTRLAEGEESSAMHTAPAFVQA
jgi:serine phosphatase RsbU (regulator of sigma subunit)